LFLTVAISLGIIKAFAFFDKTAGVFKKYRQHDLALYNKFQAFFSDDEMVNFLTKLKYDSKFKKSTLSRAKDLQALMSANANKYASDILKHHVQKFLSKLDELKYFLVVNFSESLDEEDGLDWLVLLPENKRDLANKEKAELYNQDPKTASILEEKKDFYYQKERELRTIANATEQEYLAYRDIIRKYLNV